MKSNTDASLWQTKRAIRDYKQVQELYHGLPGGVRSYDQSLESVLRKVKGSGWKKAGICLAVGALLIITGFYHFATEDTSQSNEQPNDLAMHETAESNISKYSSGLYDKPSLLKGEDVKILTAGVEDFHAQDLENNDKQLTFRKLSASSLAPGQIYSLEGSVMQALNQSHEDQFRPHVYKDKAIWSEIAKNPDGNVIGADVQLCNLLTKEKTNITKNPEKTNIALDIFEDNILYQISNNKNYSLMLEDIVSGEKAEIDKMHIEDGDPFSIFYDSKIENNFIVYSKPEYPGKRVPDANHSLWCHNLNTGLREKIAEGKYVRDFSIGGPWVVYENDTASDDGKDYLTAHNLKTGEKFLFGFEEEGKAIYNDAPYIKNGGVLFYGVDGSSIYVSEFDIQNKTFKKLVGVKSDFYILDPQICAGDIYWIEPKAQKDELGQYYRYDIYGIKYLGEGVQAPVQEPSEEPQTIKERAKEKIIAFLNRTKD